jgi:hypothetical protein
VHPDHQSSGSATIFLVGCYNYLAAENPLLHENFLYTDWNPRFLSVSTGLEAAHICCLGECVIKFVLVCSLLYSGGISVMIPD